MVSPPEMKNGRTPVFQRSGRFGGEGISPFSRGG
jgi:hypothetical protein